MTKVQIIHQLETLIEDAESHRNSDGTLDEVFQNDVEALRYAMIEVKRRSVSIFCSRFQKCRDCPLERVRCECCCYDIADENELDVRLKEINVRKGMTGYYGQQH